jgi:hypothetical protein
MTTMTKTKRVVIATALALFGATSIHASTDAQRIDLSYKNNPCEQCWARTSANGANATISSDTVFFNSQGEDHARAEFRFKTLTGERSFVGTMQPTYWQPGTGDMAVFQIFSEESGKPRIMLSLDYNGYFYNEIGGAGCQNGIRAFVGTPYKISATLNATNGNARVWVNDQFCTEIPASTSAGKLYIKIGSYRTDSGTGTLTTKWSNFNIY